MSHASTCPRCGAPLETPAASCSACLLALAGETAHGQRLGPAFLDDLPLPVETLVIADKYTVIETIARGGMGVVYKARQENLNRIVAVKMLLGGVHAGEDYKRRFIQEAKAAAALNHPNIVSIHDWGEDSGQPYFSMDFIEGNTLAEMARERPLPPRVAAEIVRTLAQAMHFAHSQGVLHRDLKPSNVLVDATGVPRITDFGLARQLNEETLLTASGDVLGTPGYLPPEQVSLKREQVGCPSDVYGLGGILYYLLTGRAPHVAPSAAEALRAVLEREPSPPRRLNPATPLDLEIICLKCLEKEPQRRYQTAALLADDLQRFLDHQPIRAVAPSLAHRVAKFCRRNRAALLRTAAASVIACAVVSGLFLMSGKRPVFVPPRDASPASRNVLTPPHIRFEEAISDVYVRDHSVLAPGPRMLGLGSHLFIRLKPGPGGWRVFELSRLELVPAHSNSVAYTFSEDGQAVIELALADGRLVCGPFGQNLHVPVTPLPVGAADFGKAITIPRTINGLVVGALPTDGILFAFEADTGRVTWTASVAEHIKSTAGRQFIDKRVGHLAADGGVVLAGLWGSRIWAVDAATGTFKWTWQERGMGNSIHVVAANGRVFGFSASGTGYGLDGQSGAMIWQKSVARCDDEDAVVAWGDRLIMCPQAGPLFSLNQADGEWLWDTALVSDGQRSVKALGDFVVSAAGRFLQRFDPRSGAPGAFIELPTLKKAVTLFGKDHPVEISHPPVLFAQDEVHAFTLDGSLWGLHLPAASTNLTVAATVTPHKGTAGDPAQVSPTNRPTPPLPAEAIRWRARVTQEGRAHLWPALEAKIDSAWRTAQLYSRALGGSPHVIMGRVVTPGSEDPRDVSVQMEVLEGGLFAGAVKDLDRPIGFRLPGALPVELPLKGRTGEVVFVGDIVLQRALPAQLGSVHGRITLAGSKLPNRPQLKFGISHGSINTPSNGTEPRRHWPEQKFVPVQADGTFEISGLTATDHWLSITADGCLPLTRTFSVSPGCTSDLGTLSLVRPVAITVTWSVAPKASFANESRQTASLKGGDRWAAVPHPGEAFDLRLNQSANRLWFDYSYGPCRLADLGEMSFDEAVAIRPDSQAFDATADVQPGHVYLVHQQHGGFGTAYWILLRVDELKPAP